MIALEYHPDDPIADRNFQQLARTQLDTGGQSAGIRFGKTTVTYAGGTMISGNATVTHGLGTTPVVVLTQSSGIAHHSRPASIGASQFFVAARTVDGSTPGAGTTVDIWWVAIG